MKNVKFPDKIAGRSRSFIETGVKKLKAAKADPKAALALGAKFDDKAKTTSSSEGFKKGRKKI